jgi:hypothetical protein
MNTGYRWAVAVVAWVSAVSMAVHAQQPPPGSAPPPGSRSGNPTPGTPQPDPPNLADRITLTGCVQAASGPGAGSRKDPNNPSDSRFVLTKAERKNEADGKNATSSVAASSTGPTYRLNAIDSQLSPFVGTKVEISGEVLPSAPGGGEAARKAPSLQVEFVQKLSETCS